MVAGGLATPTGIDSADRRNLYYVTSANVGDGVIEGAINRIDTDDGTPSLLTDTGLVDASMWGLGVLPPMGWVQSVASTEGRAEIEWHSVSGVVYRVESTLQLVPLAWSPETTVVGTGGWMGWTSTGPSPSPFFLRVIALPGEDP